MKMLVVAGVRPSLIKAADILRALRTAGEQGVLACTGPHYDLAMLDAFLTDLERQKPDFHLGVGSSCHAVQTASAMAAY